MGKNGVYKVIDVFAGCGGLGEGFAAIGLDKGKHSFQLALSIEKDASAHSTLLLRSFFRQFKSEVVPKEYWQFVRGELPKTELFKLYPRQAAAAAVEAKCIELGKTPHADIRDLINQRLNGDDKWVLVGGPPCQAYSTVGRSRMQSNPEFEKDKRHFLYKEYLKIIADHRPPVFVMENVKGMLSAQYSGERLIHKILYDLQHPGGHKSGCHYRLFSLGTARIGTSLEPEDFLIRAEEYGIPQSRHRVLILGIRDDIDITPDTLSRQKAPSVMETIGDLPRIRSTLSRERDTLEQWQQILHSVVYESWYKKGRNNGLAITTKRIDDALHVIRHENLQPGAEILKYTCVPKINKKWYRYNCDGIIINHDSRSHMRTDLYRYLFASSFADVNGRSAQLRDFPSALLPAHRNIEKSVVDIFDDRFRVQLADKPSTTITSHISKDGHYFIHYDPSQCRSLTVREAARLQTFPDNYKFEGSRTSQYRQVGNAVPPLLSMQIAQIVYAVLKRIRL